MLEGTPQKPAPKPVKSALGKGLSSLIPVNTPTPTKEVSLSGESNSTESPGPNKDRHLGISVIPISEIRVNPFQPRREFDESAIQELSQSIQINGLIQPLVVRKMTDHYELIAGERRLRASRLAGLTHVPIVIRKSTDKESLELALIENIQRENLNCVDEALAYFQLMQDFKLTQEQVADRVGKQRVSIANSLRLLKLPEGILDDLRQGRLSSGHGKALLGLDALEDRLRMRAQIIEHHWSVRETEAQIHALQKGKAEMSDSLMSNHVSSQAASHGDSHEAVWSRRRETLEQQLTRAWFTKIEIKGSEKKGRLVLCYQSQGELERFLEVLQARTATAPVAQTEGKA